MWSPNFQAGCCTGMLFMLYILRKTAMRYLYSITHHTVFHTCIVVLMFQQFKNKINTKHVILFFNTHHLMHNWHFLTPPNRHPQHIPVLILKQSEGLFSYYSMFIVPIGSSLPVTLPTHLNHIPTPITSTLMMVAARPSKA